MSNEDNPPNIRVNLASAALANSLSYFLFHPFSTMVNRVQTHDTPIKSLIELQKTVFLEAHQQHIGYKLQTLFNGSTAALSYKVITRTTKYTLQPILADFTDTLIGQAATERFGVIHGSSLVQAIAGGMVGATEVALFHPLNTLKTRRQASDCRSLSEFYRLRPAVFYNGYAMAFAKSIPASFVLFGTNQGVMSYYAIQDPHDVSFRHQLVAASAGVVIGGLVTNPQDVVIKRAQGQAVSVRSFTLFKEVLQQQGVRGLYRGFMINTLVSLPKKAAPFALYSYFLSHWRAHTEEPERQYNDASHQFKQ